MRCLLNLHGCMMALGGESHTGHKLDAVGALLAECMYMFLATRAHKSVQEEPLTTTTTRRQLR